MKQITTIRAKEIASHWHGGQWSALYQFASSGIMTDENTLRYFREVEDALHPEYNLYPGELTQKEERELTLLKRYFLIESEKRGLPVEFHKHELYGYLIPYLMESVPDDRANNVAVLKYMK